MRSRTLFGALLTLPLALACQRPAPPAAAPGPATPAANADAPPPEPPTLLEPPAAGISPEAPFPPIVHASLENGLGVRIIERRVHPIVELRLVVRSGSATDGDKPGLAALAGELLKDGGAGGLPPRQLVERAEALGATLTVRTDRDSTRISLGVTSGDFEAALAILADVALRPTLPAGELDKLKAREIEARKSAARGNASWAAAMVLFRELYELPATVHPYSRYDALPEDIEKIKLADVKRWHKAHFVPANASLVVVGDVSAKDVQVAAEKTFGAWKGDAPPRPSFSMPERPSSSQVYLVDRPGSPQSQIYVGLLGPERTSPEWPALTVANQILGGGVSGRLFMDVREKRSLAYSTSSFVSELATGPVPLVLSAGTQTEKTEDAVAALLENLEALATRAPSEAELEMARRFLADSFVFKLETVGSVAELATALYVLSLPDDHYDQYRRAVRELDVAKVAAVAGRRYAGRPVIVVAGDGKALGPKLARFGEVAVLDPERGFALKRSHTPAPAPAQ